MLASSATMASAAPAAPSGTALHLISALSNPQPADVHAQALRARDEALSASPTSYGELCVQLSCCLAGCDNPSVMLSRIHPSELESWRQMDPHTVSRLQHDADLWIPFGQMAGLVLKNALVRPPPALNNTTNNGSNGSDGGRYFMALQPGPHAEQVKQTLLFALGCQQSALRSVASSVIAVTSVSNQHIQPTMHVRQWPQLIPTLIHLLQPSHDNTPVQDGALSTIQKMMEDGPAQLDPEELDLLVPALLRFLVLNPDSSSSNNNNKNETAKIHALSTLCTCLTLITLPNALILHFASYLQALSSLVTDPSIQVRRWVCRSIVTLLELRTEYIAAYLDGVARFMLETTAAAITASSSSSPSSSSSHHQESSDLALEACEFWLTFSSTLVDDAMTPDMMETVQALLPQLIPILLSNMVYQEEQRMDILARNEVESSSDLRMMNNNTAAGGGGGAMMRPIFHRSRAHHGGGDAAGAVHHHHSTHDDGRNGEDDDEEEEDGYEQDDENGFDDCDDDGNEWTLRKCSAASLDSLANLYGAEPILPPLLPELEKGLSSTDPWVQEASILALGAIAEGCSEEMSPHLTQLHPYLLNHLRATNTLPQVSCIAAWTLGRYASWVVEQVQSGAQGHLLAQMTEVFLSRLNDPNRRVQVAICSAFGRIVEASGDLMAPYLEPIYRATVSVMSFYQGRSLLLLFDLFGNMADCCGPAIAEGELPSIYIPPILHTWNQIALHDPTDRMLLPLMECLASISMISGMNFQPYALESFDNAMGIIEAVQLILATSGEKIEDNEEDADPIICAADLLDGLVEGMGENFPVLLASSHRYGQHFLSVLHALCKHDIAGVRMSALALVGDLAKQAPQVLQPALPQILEQALLNMDPIQPTVCTNAVWAVGEICARCEGNPEPLKDFAPTLIQNLIALLVGNGVGHGNRGSDIPGLAENAAACVGRLAKVDPAFVAKDLSRFLMGWCDGMAKISDPNERRDAFQGFIRVLYANPQAIQQACENVPDAVASILFAVIAWHMPPDLPDRSVGLLTGEYSFLPFPSNEAELGVQVHGLVQDMREFVGEDTWFMVQRNLPVNVRRLLRENYQI